MRMMSGCDVISPQAMVHLPRDSENPSDLSEKTISSVSAHLRPENPTKPVMKFFLKKCKETWTSTKNGFPSLFSTKNPLVSSTSTVGHVPSKVTSSPHRVTLETLLSSSMMQKLKQYDISMPKSTSTSQLKLKRKPLGAERDLNVGSFLKLVGFFDVFFFQKSIDQKTN